MTASPTPVRRARRSMSQSIDLRGLNPPPSVPPAHENARPKPGESNQLRPARPQAVRMKRVVRRNSTDSSLQSAAER